jgi:hypothetical protein
MTHLQKFRNCLRWITRVIVACWLCFPAVLFILVMAIVLPNLSQGLDLMLFTSELGKKSIFLVFGTFCWAYSTWYSSRIICYGREDLFAGMGKFFIAWFCRYLGYMCFHIIVITILVMWLCWNKTDLPAWVCWLRSELVFFELFIFVSGFICFRIMWWPLDKLKTICDNISDSDKKKKYLGRLFFYGLTIVYLILVLYIRYGSKSVITLLCTVLFTELVFLAMVIFRRDFFSMLRMNGTNVVLKYRLFKKFAKNSIRNRKTKEQQEEEDTFFIVLIILVGIMLALYSASVLFLMVARFIGPLSVCVFGVTTIVGIFQLVKYVSIRQNINIIFLLMVFLFLVGAFSDAHYVKLHTNAGVNYDKRPSLNAYLENWVKQRRDSIASAKTYPVVFVLADGGASRSAYWVASVLSRLEEKSHSNFSEHLFCLSGASGGSFGNATFLSLLKYRQEAKDSVGFYSLSKSYLGSDFLSFTLSRMLGPDVFFSHLVYRPSQYLFPDCNIYDRADALRCAFESRNTDTIISKYMSRSVWDYVPADHTAKLPLICINVTRMQGGRPSVITTLKNEAGIFGSRLDILSDVLHDSLGQDLHLSTGVVLGARFPYVSPAGRINDSYFVDGGYFDNSGAGFVHEMIQNLEKIRDTSHDSLYKKLRWIVIHVSNSPQSIKNLGSVNSVANDALAPVMAILGTYSEQTDVNDSRLKIYLENNVQDKRKNYYDINLYTEEDPDEKYSMNWTISQKTRRHMSDRLEALEKNGKLDTILVQLKSKR